jgi:UDP-N-acetylmuramoyl-tripeptide--D-alanyl-D-alanine ligase
VLNVGTAHVGEFGGRDRIAIAKAELVQALPADGGAVLNADDPVVAAMAAHTQARVVRVGESPDADVRAERRHASTTSGRPSLRPAHPRRCSAQGDPGLHGRHHVGNALAVLAVALACGLPLDAASSRPWPQAGPVSRWRMEVTERPDGMTVVNDAYNANPDSMAAALQALHAMGRPTTPAGRPTEPSGGRPSDPPSSTAPSGTETPTRRTWAVLGAMLELGEDSDREHRGVGALAADLGIDRVLAVGAGAAPIADGALAAGCPAEAVLRAADADAAYQLLVRDTRPGDVVLFKSSRDSGLRWLGERFAVVGTGDGPDDARGGTAT